MSADTQPSAAATASAKVTSTGGRKASAKSARTRAREFALQALYQHIVGKNQAGDIDTFTRDLSGFNKADAAHFDALLHGCIESTSALNALIAPLIDRPLSELSPIEQAAMWMGCYEFQHCLDVPWRVVLNEYIELVKDFGGTDGHKYVNGVLNGLAPKLRADEVNHDRSTGRATLKPKGTSTKTPIAVPGQGVPVTFAPREEGYNSDRRQDHRQDHRPRR